MPMHAPHTNRGLMKLWLVASCLLICMLLFTAVFAQQQRQQALNFESLLHNTVNNQQQANDAHHVAATRAWESLKTLHKPNTSKSNDKQILEHKQHLRTLRTLGGPQVSEANRLVQKTRLQQWAEQENDYVERPCARIGDPKSLSNLAKLIKLSTSLGDDTATTNTETCLSPNASFFNPTGIQPRHEIFPEYLKEENLKLLHVLEEAKTKQLNQEQQQQQEEDYKQDPSYCLYPSPPIKSTSPPGVTTFNANIIPLPPNPKKHRYLFLRRTTRAVPEELKRFSTVSQQSGIAACYADIFPVQFITQSEEYAEYIDVSTIHNYEEIRAVWFGYKNAKEMPWIAPIPQKGPDGEVEWAMHCTTKIEYSFNTYMDQKYLSENHVKGHLGFEDTRAYWDACGQLLATTGHLNDKRKQFFMSMRLINLKQFIFTNQTRVEEITQLPIAERHTSPLANDEISFLPIATLPMCNIKNNNGDETNSSSPPQHHNPTSFIFDQYHLDDDRTQNMEYVEKNWLFLHHNFGTFFHFNQTRILWDILQQQDTNTNNNNFYNPQTNELLLTKQQFVEYNKKYAQMHKDALQVDRQHVSILRHTTPLLLSHGDRDIFEVDGRVVDKEKQQQEDKQQKKEEDKKIHFLTDPLQKKTDELLNTGLKQCFAYHERFDLVQDELHQATNMILLKIPPRNNNTPPQYVYVHIIQAMDSRAYKWGNIRMYRPILVFFDALTLQQIGYYSMHSYDESKLDRQCGDQSLIDCTIQRDNHKFHYTHTLWSNTPPLSIKVDLPRGEGDDNEDDDITRQNNPKNYNYVVQSYHLLTDQFYAAVNVDDVITWHQEINLQYVYDNLSICPSAADAITRHTQPKYIQKFVEGRTREASGGKLRALFKQRSGVVPLGSGSSQNEL